MYPQSTPLIRRLRRTTGLTLIALCGGLGGLTLHAQANDTEAQAPQSVTLEFFRQPVSSWSKERLVGEVLPNNDGVRVYDATPELGPFDDADLFRADTRQTLPYGVKRLSMDVVMGAEHRTLWENRLIQFQLNGRELSPWVDGDEADFVLDIGPDGKGFVPAVSRRFQFEVDKEVQDVHFLSFMTGGAEHFDVTLRNVRIDVWPEVDVRPRSYLLRYNRIGYLPGQRQWAVLEWQPDLPNATLPLTVSRSGGTAEVAELVRPSTAYSGSGRALAVADFTHRQEPGFYTLVVPEAGGRTRHTTAVFQNRVEPIALRQQRDLAWGGFHWFNSAAYPGAHEQDAAARVFGSDETRDIRGGWYDAGDYGQYVVNGAWSVALPLLTHLLTPDAVAHDISPLHDRDPSRLAILDLLRQELDWLLTMQRDDGGVHHKAASAAWPLLNLPPQQDTSIKYIMPVSTTATASFSAVMHLAASAYGASSGNGDAVQAARYRAAADRADAFLAAHPELIMIQDRYDNIEYGGPYTDTRDTDERLWAATARLWNEPDAELEQAVFSRLWQLSLEPRLGDRVPDWRDTYFLAFFSFLANPEVHEGRRQALAQRVERAFVPLRAAQRVHPFGLMYAGQDDQFDWGSNGVIATVGTQLMWLYQLTGNTEWRSAAYDMSHWFYGLNPHGLQFTVGPSRFQVQSPHFRPQVSDTIKVATGLLSGGPNSRDLKGDIAAEPLAGGPPMLVYVDHQESWATNEVAINWQAAYASYLSLLVHAFE